MGSPVLSLPPASVGARKGGTVLGAAKLIAGVVAVLLIAGVAIGLYMVAENMAAPQQPMQEVIPDDKFPS